MRRALPIAVLLSTAAVAAPQVEERSIEQLQAEMTSGRTTSAALVRAYLQRIAAIDRRGPTLRAVLAVEPQALEEARALDTERKAGRLRGPLHGIPVLVKDNIETKGPLPTTAGSLALAANVTGRDAPLVARLRAAGAVILGKTNLSEWANIRSPRSTSGWSAMGGLTRNPYALDRNACGSSSGSGAAAAASLAAAAVGTETDGSITCPSAVNGLVGLKPTVGLVSRTHVVPISHSQDTAGPMARSVRDAALLLAAMAGSDQADAATAGADARRSDYLATLDAQALRGRRIGVLRFAATFDPAVTALFDRALAEMAAAGATLVEIAKFDTAPIDEAEDIVLHSELKSDLNAYLATTPATVKVRSLADTIAFNKAEAAREMPWFGQQSFEKAERTGGTADPAYRAAAARGRRLAGPEGVDRMLAADRLDVLVSPTVGPAWTSDLVASDHYTGGGAGSLAAVAGYPHLTVPMGQVHGLPIGLSFFGPAWSEARLLSIGYSYEQRTRLRTAPTYRPSIP